MRLPSSCITSSLNHKSVKIADSLRWTYTWKMVFCGWNETLSDVYSCSIHALSIYEKTIGSRDWTEALKWSVTTHWRDTKQYLLFEFLLKWHNLKAETLFHIRKPSLLVLLVSSHCSVMYFSLRNNMCVAALYVGQSNSNCCGQLWAGFVNGQLGHDGAIHFMDINVSSNKSC